MRGITTQNENADGRPLVRLFTDGACLGNPGPGGWAYLLQHPLSGRCKEGSGGEQPTTNNRMEIMAVIRGLEALKTPSRVELFSDSKYVVESVNEWMEAWKRFGWKRSAKSTALVRNDDLWRQVDLLLQRHSLLATWVQGHSGHPENERCDQLATAAAAKAAADPIPVRSATPSHPPRPETLFDVPHAPRAQERT